MTKTRSGLQAVLVGREKARPGPGRQSREEAEGGEKRQEKNKDAAGRGQRMGACGGGWGIAGVQTVGAAAGRAVAGGGGGEEGGGGWAGV